MIVVTDGVPNIGNNPTAEAAAAAAAARGAGTEIYVVGVGDGVNADYLRDQIASPLGADHYFAGDFSTLQTTMVDIVSCESSS
jgi:Mg-chelatase subunit ChlD